MWIPELEISSKWDSGLLVCDDKIWPLRGELRCITVRMPDGQMEIHGE
jgi:hypothetical protein